MQLHFHLLLEVVVVLLEDLDHLGLRELRRHGLALAHQLAEHGAREQQPRAALVLAVLVDDGLALVRAGLHRGHRAALVAVERPVHVEGPEHEGVGRDLAEDLLRVERAVVVADAGVVTADDQVRAAVVLAEHGVQQGLARPGVAHLHRVAALDDALLAEVIVDQRVDGLHADVSAGMSPGFSLPTQLVDVHAVAHLDGHPGQVGVRVVHRVAQLQGRDRAPVALLELLARLGRPLVDALEHLRGRTTRRRP